MKKYLAPMICSFLLVGVAVAALTPEQEAFIKKSTEISMRAFEIRLEAEARAMEQCEAIQFVASLPRMNSVTEAEETYDETVTIEWSGACADGKRDGEGGLTWIENHTTHTKTSATTTLTSRSVTTYKSQGQFVKGRRVGLWCTERKYRRESKTEDFTYPLKEGGETGCAVFGGHAKQLTGNFRKQPDGSWMAISGDQPTGVTLAPGMLEAQGARVLADAAAGKLELKVDLVHVAQSKALDDLVRGSKIVLEQSREPILLKDKRIGIVLSSRTISELERFKRERQALIASSSGLTGSAGKFRDQFIAASDPNRLLTNIAKILRKHVKSVIPAYDLTGLQQGKFDYALIVDWKHQTRLDLLGKFDSLPAVEPGKRVPINSPQSYSGQSLEAFLISRELKAVKHSPGTDYGNGRLKDYVDDQAYMARLASSFESYWGKGPDDVGFLTTGLDFILKN